MSPSLRNRTWSCCSIPIWRRCCSVDAPRHVIYEAFNVESAFEGQRCSRRTLIGTRWSRR